MARPLQPKYDPADDRDLEILTRSARGEEPAEIASAMEIPRSIVSGVLAADRAAFPNDPPRIVN